MLQIRFNLIHKMRPFLTARGDPRGPRNANDVPPKVWWSLKWVWNEFEMSCIFGCFKAFCQFDFFICVQKWEENYISLSFCHYVRPQYYLYYNFFLVAPAARQGAPFGALQWFHPRTPDNSSYSANVNVRANIRANICVSQAYTTLYQHLLVQTFVS